MNIVQGSFQSLAARLALAALMLAACAPAVGTPTTAPTPLPTATLPPTAAPTLQGTAAIVGNIPVPAISFALQFPTDVVFDGDGNLYVSECADALPQVLKIDNFGRLTPFAAYHQGGFSGDGGPATAAEIACAEGLAFDHDGNLYIADVLNNRIRKVNRSGLISTVAGSGPLDGTPGAFSGDGGPATQAVLQLPTDIAFDPAGNLYISDSNNFRIRKVDRQGLITTVAGTGQRGFSGDGGPATSAQINAAFALGPVLGGLTFDAAGNLYFADSNNGRVRKIDTQGIITTIAGDGGSQLAGDGGPAISATLSIPTGLAFDVNGNLYVATKANASNHVNRIRKIDPNGLITTVAGNDSYDFPAESVPATASTLNGPSGLAFDVNGNLFFVDIDNSLVRKIDKDGIITAVAGVVY